MGKSARTLSSAAEALLTSYGWPGNVRELENAIERAMVVGRGDTIEADDLPMRAPDDGVVVPDDRSLAALERAHIERTLDDLDGNVTRTAKVLGIDRATLYNKLKRYGIRR
jgi:DNA-binding NtrC family response regulator